MRTSWQEQSFLSAVSREKRIEISILLRDSVRERRREEVVVEQGLVVRQRVARRAAEISRTRMTMSRGGDT